MTMFKALPTPWGHIKWLSGKDTPAVATLASNMSAVLFDDADPTGVRDPRREPMRIAGPPPPISIGADGLKLTALRVNPRRKRASRGQGILGWNNETSVTE
jgi:hypothetical protein